MADGATYAVRLVQNNIVELAGSLVFENAAAQPVPNAPPITSGTLPNTGAWVSGTAKVNPAGRPITVAVEIVGDATNNIASCVVAISPDNSTFTTLGTPSLAAAVNNTGAITMLVNVPLP